VPLAACKLRPSPLQPRLTATKATIIRSARISQPVPPAVRPLPIIAALRCLRGSLRREKNIGFFYFCINPESEDTGGLLGADWKTCALGSRLHHRPRRTLHPTVFLLHCVLTSPDAMRSAQAKRRKARIAQVDAVQQGC